MTGVLGSTEGAAVCVQRRDVRPASNDDECADLLIRAAMAMGLNPHQARRVFCLASRSRMSFYRDWKRLKGQPLRLASLGGGPDDD